MVSDSGAINEKRLKPIYGLFYKNKSHFVVYQI